MARARNIKDVPIENFEHIIPMDDYVAATLRMEYPNLNSRLMGSWNIQDPFRGDDEAYRAAAKQIQKNVEMLSPSL